MEFILVALIVAILNGSILYIDEMLMNIVDITLYAERYMSNISGVNFVAEVNEIIVGFGVSLIILKFIKKGFDTYVMWSGAPAEEEPYTLLINFVKAIAVALCFPIMYSWMAIIVADMSSETLNSIGVGTNNDWQSWVDGFQSFGIMTSIFGLIFIICYFILYLQFLKRGLEMLILRIGVPIACVGLIDNDGGIFKSYLTIFFKAMVTVIVQVSLLMLSVELMIKMHVFWGMACMVTAISTPKFIAEFMVAGGIGGGVSNNLYQSVRLMGMTKRIFIK